MTIHVKKRAADAFAAGTLTEAQFAREAEVTTYLGEPIQDRNRLILGDMNLLNLKR